MSQWPRKYSDDQRAAVLRAAFELQVSPAAEIARMAAAGELRPAAGKEPLEPFEIPASTVRSEVRAARRRRAGLEVRSELARMPARDRVQHFSDRLSALIDADLERVEAAHRAKPKNPVDAEQLRRLARATRELAALPAPGDRRLPRAPGERDEGERVDHPTRDSLAGQLLRAAKPQNPRMAALHNNTNGDRAGEQENTGAADATHDDEEGTGDERDLPT